MYVEQDSFIAGFRKLRYGSHKNVEMHVEVRHLFGNKLIGGFLIVMLELISFGS